MHMHEYRYMLMVLMSYAWAMMPILFLLSFTFKEATSAYVWVTFANVLSGTSDYFCYVLRRFGLALFFQHNGCL